LVIVIIHGHVRFTENVQITYDHDYTLEPIKGDIYMVVRNATSTLEPSMAYIHLTNLFNGDPLLGECQPCIRVAERTNADGR
jgi:hypothetical protein